MAQNYQLTKHSVGTMREFWAMSWPLMLGLFSGSLMTFVDRLFLARYDIMALNASATAGIAYWMLLMLPMGVVSIAEVLVGRLHGENALKKTAPAALSMAAFGPLSAPIFALMAWLFPSMLFYGSENIFYEAQYFSTLTYFAPAQLTQVAFVGFFIAIGRVKIVTFATIVGNAVNILLDYGFIFGFGAVSPMGMFGAALATGIAQVTQLAILASLFFSAPYRRRYGSAIARIDWGKMREGVALGLPAALGSAMELLCHFLFFRMVSSVAIEQMSVVTAVQSIYLLISFLAQAQSKTMSAICANLIGAKELLSIKRVLKAGFLQQVIISSLLLTVCCIAAEPLWLLFRGDDLVALGGQAGMFATFRATLIIMVLFFLCDGLAWLFAGLLTASGDTRYLFWVSIFVNSIAYMLPAVYFIYWLQAGAIVAWSICTAVSLLTLFVYFVRYRTGAYLHSHRSTVELCTL